MTEVWICYYEEQHYEGTEFNLIKIVDSEEKAVQWKQEVINHVREAQDLRNRWDDDLTEEYKERVLVPKWEEIKKLGFDHDNDPKCFYYNKMIVE